MASRGLRVAAFTAGAEVPSTRIRVRQYRSALAARKITVTEHAAVPNKFSGVPFGVPRRAWEAIQLASRVPGLVSARGADVVWLEREFVFKRRTLERFARTPERRVLDVDDAIWLDGDGRFSERIAGECAGVIAGNSHIAAHYKNYTPKTWVVPTSVDMARWRRERAPTGDRWVVGWSGTSGNFRYLKAIEEPLCELLSEVPEMVLSIVADRPIEWRKLPRSRWKFTRWSEATEVSLVHAMNVGLMPLAMEPWALGKCAAKMLISMASGQPVVVTPVGVNEEILQMADVGFGARTPEEWYRHLRWLYDHRDRADEMGARGAALVEERFSLEHCADELAEIFRSVAGG